MGSPYNTWVGVTLTANNTYLQKRGTTYTGASVRPASQSSSASTPLTIGAYYNADGSDNTSRPRPIINHNGGTNGVGAVFVDTCANVVVRDIAGTNSMASLGGGVTVRRSQGVLILNCATYLNEHGICIQQDQASVTSTCTDITVQGCEIYANVGGGVCLRWGTASTAIFKRIVVDDNTVYGNGTGKGFGSGGTAVPCGGIQSYTLNKASIGTAGFISYDIKVTNNNVRDNNGYGINIEGFSNESWGSMIDSNTVTGSGYSGDVDSHSLWAGNVSGLAITNNTVHDNSANIGAATGSGVGIYLDWNASSSTIGTGCTIKRNVVYNQFRGATTAAQLAAGAGILVSYSTAAVVESNVVYNCRNGINIFTSADGTQVRGNTVVDSTDCGISVLAGGINSTLKNNCVKGGATGLFCTTTVTGYAETFNAVYGCTTARANGTPAAQTSTPLHVSDLVSDPLLIERKPASTSPLIGAGTHIAYCRAANGIQRPNPPSIGAYDSATLRRKLTTDPAA